jgi:hypothetical protein
LAFLLRVYAVNYDVYDDFRSSSLGWQAKKGTAGAAGLKRLDGGDGSAEYLHVNNLVMVPCAMKHQFQQSPHCTLTYSLHI